MSSQYSFSSKSDFLLSIYILVQKILGKKKVWNFEAWWWNISRALARFLEISPCWKIEFFEKNWRSANYCLFERRANDNRDDTTPTVILLLISEISIDRVVNKLLSFIYSFPDKERSSKKFFISSFENLISSERYDSN